jgi:hypothetical protein
VLVPGSPLGLITEGVQTLAGVLLPSATVFLLLLCNDREVLGPWVNSRRTNIFTSLVVAVLVMLSIVLTAAVLFPAISSRAILGILIVGIDVGLAGAAVFLVRRRRDPARSAPPDRAARSTWRMPPLTLLTRPKLSTGRRAGLTVLRLYLLIATGLVIVRVAQIAAGH